MDNKFTFFSLFFFFFFFFFSSLFLFVSTQHAFINEVDLPTKTVEIEVFERLDFHYQLCVETFKPILRKFIDIDGLDPGLHTVQFENEFTEDRLYIYLFRSDKRDEPLNVRVPDRIILTLDNAENPTEFNEWKGKLKFVSSFENYCRCDFNIFDPDSFVLCPPTIGKANICNLVQGDPHFVQTIIDQQTSKSIRICYDVTGESGQSIFIVEDKLVETKVNGILLDDYYMHQINIENKGKLLQINVDSINYLNRKFEWRKGENLYFEDTIIEILNDDEIKIENFKNNFSLTTLIKKSTNNWNVKHLNVGFLKGKNETVEFSRRNFKRYGGLIGDIQQLKASIIDGVQNEESMRLKVDNGFIDGRLERRMGGECLLVSVNELIRPRKISDYIN